MSTTPPAADPQPDPAPARAAAETPLPSTAVGASAAPAVDNHTDARAIVEESQRRSEARFYQYDGLLQSYDTNNTVTEKRWMFDRQGSHGQSKSVLRFTAPPEVKGVALLIYNHPERASDQWMWTPAIERDRRIAFQDRSTRFFGTDFTFEDLEERDVDQYDHTMLGADTVDGAACWKIQSTPKKTRSSQVHALDRLDPERQLHDRTARQLRQGRRRPPAAVVEPREHPGHLDGATPRHDRLASRDTHATQPAAGQIQLLYERRSLHAAGDPALVLGLANRSRSIAYSRCADDLVIW